MKWFKGLLKVAYVALIAVLPVAAIADYSATTGAGLTFGSFDLAGVKFPAFVGCDPVTAKQCWSISAAGAVKVDGSAFTQPVSLTSTTITGTAAVTQSGTWTVQPGNTANTTPWLVSVPTWAGGTLGAMANYGTSPGAVLVPGVNAFITNATPGIANNADGIAAVAASSSSPVPVNNYAYVYNGTTWDRMRSGTQTGSVAVASADPCLGANKTNLPISQNGTSSVQLVALSGSTVIYVCSVSLVAAGATTAVLTTGTGSACVTGNAAVLGDTTANIANGLSFAANGGLTLGNGAGTIAKGAASSELCMTLGTNVRMSGNLTYVQQ